MVAAAFSAVITLLFLSISSPSVNGNFAPVVDCDAVVLNLAGCMSFVTIGGTDLKPSASCCTGLQKVVDTNVKCLCQGLTKSGRMGVQLNVTKSETLPSFCKVTAPPLSSCLSPAPAGGPKQGPRSASAPAPSRSHGSSLIPVSAGWSFVISGALVVLFSHI